MRFTRALRGGGNWDLIPPEKIPSPNFWNKVVKGTPYEFTQVQLSRKGLHHAWTRHEIAKYDTVMRRNPYMLTLFNDELLKLAVIITAGIIFAEEICGFYPFGHDPHQGHGASASPAFNDVQINGVPEVQGDEHTRYYRGQNCVSNDHFMQPTTVTPENK